jgi:hypothetical protein
VGRIDAAAALSASTEVAPEPEPEPTTPAATPSQPPGVAGAGDDVVADLPEGTDATEAPPTDPASPDTGDGVVAAPTGEPAQQSGALGLVATALLLASLAATWLEARARRDD